MSWPRNPRISDSLRERNRREPTTARYEDKAVISGAELILADLRHLVDSTEEWPAGARIRVSSMRPYGGDQSVCVIAEDTM